MHGRKRRVGTSGQGPVPRWARALTGHVGGGGVSSRSAGRAALRRSETAHFGVCQYPPGWLGRWKTSFTVGFAGRGPPGRGKAGPKVLTTVEVWQLTPQQSISRRSHGRSEGTPMRLRIPRWPGAARRAAGRDPCPRRRPPPRRPPRRALAPAPAARRRRRQGPGRLGRLPAARPPARAGRRHPYPPVLQLRPRRLQRRRLRRHLVLPAPERRLRDRRGARPRRGAVDLVHPRRRQRPAPPAGSASNSTASVVVQADLQALVDGRPRQPLRRAPRQQRRPDLRRRHGQGADALPASPCGSPPRTTRSSTTSPTAPSPTRPGCPGSTRPTRPPTWSPCCAPPAPATRSPRSPAPPPPARRSPPRRGGRCQPSPP